MAEKKTTYTVVDKNGVKYCDTNGKRREIGCGKVIDQSIIDKGEIRYQALETLVARERVKRSGDVPQEIKDIEKAEKKQSEVDAVKIAAKVKARIDKKEAGKIIANANAQAKKIVDAAKIKAGAKSEKAQEPAKEGDK